MRAEDFVAVYQMHPLIPDDFDLRSHLDDATHCSFTFSELAFRHARGVVEQVSMGDLLYSFGTMNPGAITLHNFPRFLQRLERPDGSLVVRAATDILRSRERGVPRYNEFRRRLNSDRFFTTDYRPEAYTQMGLRWVNDNTFADVLRRHFPELGTALAGVSNPFAPWTRAGIARAGA